MVKSSLLILILLLIPLHSQTLESLLHQYNYINDLSNKTKKEDGGFLIVYTREDLNHMQITTLKELIEKIPFLKYKENRFGLTDPSYRGLTPPLNNILQIYINDRALVSGYSQNSIKLYGEIPLNYIDHAEIYLGVPSLSFGIESGAFVIKLYTKESIRENATILKTLFGSRGSQIYWLSYSGHFKDYQYYINGSYTKMNRSKFHTNKKDFSKDNESFHTFFQIKNNSQRFELEAIAVNKDAFLGTSSSFQSDQPTLQSKLVYGGWYYKENGWKNFINFTHTDSIFTDQSSSPLQYLIISKPPFFLPYRSLYLHLVDDIANIHLSKTFLSNHSSTLIGVHYRLKHFEAQKASVDNITSPFENKFNSQHIFSTFIEHSRQLSPRNEAILSIKIDKYLHNGHIPDDTLFSTRLGHIYQKGNFINKTFLMYKEVPNSIESLYNNYYIYHQTNRLKKILSGAVATRFIYKKDSQKFALLLSKTWIKRPLRYSFSPRLHIINSHRTITYDGIDLEWKKIFPVSSLRLDIWKLIAHYGTKTAQSHAVIMEYSYDYDQWMFYNDFTFKKYGNDQGFNASFTAQYQLSPHKTIIFKATNIFKNAIQQRYYSIDPFHGILQTKANTLYDRAAWIGLEWTF